MTSHPGRTSPPSPGAQQPIQRLDIEAAEHSRRNVDPSTSGKMAYASVFLN